MVSPLSLAEKPTLHGDLVTLRTVGEADVPGLLEMLADEESNRLTGTRPPDEGLNRVELEVFDFNPRARHVYEKAGFRHEGTRRQALLWEGQWVDSHIMAILAHEWANRG